jgi:hypothetical protein
VFEERYTSKANIYLRLKKFLIDNRNSDVTKALKNLYQDKLSGNESTIFCVDNMMYKEHRTDSRDVALPFLHLSGIIAVRKYCISLVASSQLRSAREYIKNDIPALLGDIDLWIQSGAGTVDAERKAEIRETVNALEAQLKRVRHGQRYSCNKLMDARTSQEMLLKSVRSRDQ